MIDDLSRAMKAVLTAPNLTNPLKSAAIDFVPPIKGYSPGNDTVNLFLYDIRENLQLRSNEPIVQNEGGKIVTIPPPLRVACTYLVTAWPSSNLAGETLALREHKLLSQVLQEFSRHPTIPKSFLTGEMAKQEFPLPMITARADGLQNPADFWTSLESHLRASLTVTVTISMDVFAKEEAHKVIISKTSLGERKSPDEEIIQPLTIQQFFRIGGVITDSNDVPLADAKVSIVEQGLTTNTDAKGQYTIGLLPSGNYTLRVEKGGVARNKGIAIPPAVGNDYNFKMT